MFVVGQEQDKCFFFQNNLSDFYIPDSDIHTEMDQRQ